MLQTVPFPIGRLLTMLAQQDAGREVPSESPVSASVRSFRVGPDVAPSSVLETERTGRATVPVLPDRGRVEARPGTRVSQEINDMLERTRQRGGPMGWGVSALDAASATHPGEALVPPVGRSVKPAGNAIGNILKRLAGRGAPSRPPLGIGGAPARPAPPPRPGGALDRARGGAGGGRWEELYEPPPRSVIDDYLEALQSLEP